MITLHRLESRPHSRTGTRVPWLLICLLVSASTGWSVPSLADEGEPTSDGSTGKATPDETPELTEEAGPETPAPEEPVARVLHVPVTSAEEGAELTITTAIEGAWTTSRLVVLYRASGGEKWEERELTRRDDGSWAATIPAEAVVGEHLEYYLASLSTEGAWRTHFANAEHPHRVSVMPDTGARIRTARLATYAGNSSRFAVRSEFVHFGVPETGPQGRVWYLLGEIDYTYRFASGLHALRIGAGLFRGELRPGEGSEFLPPNVAADRRAGFNYGYAEVRLRPHEIIFVDLRAILGAGPERFEGGGAGAVIIGSDVGTHFAIGFEGITAIGVAGFLRLQWATVRRFPMSLTLEITTRPDADYDPEPSGRLIYNIGTRLGRHVTVDARVSYGSRDFGLGSFGGGLEMGFEF